MLRSLAAKAAPRPTDHRRAVRPVRPWSRQPPAPAGSRSRPRVAATPDRLVTPSHAGMIPAAPVPAATADHRQRGPADDYLSQPALGGQDPRVGRGFREDGELHDALGVGVNAGDVERKLHGSSVTDGVSPRWRSGRPRTDSAANRGGYPVRVRDANPRPSSRASDTPYVKPHSGGRLGGFILPGDAPRGQGGEGDWRWRGPTRSWGCIRRAVNP